MDRAIRFCEWKAEKWVKAADCTHIQRAYVAEGARAYALEQVDIERRRGIFWAQSWNQLMMQARDKVLPSLEGDEEPEIDIVINIKVDDELDSGDESTYLADDDGDGNE
jgi:hypothetical protein